MRACVGRRVGLWGAACCCCSSGALSLEVVWRGGRFGAGSWAGGANGVQIRGVAVIRFRTCFVASRVGWGPGCRWRWWARPVRFGSEVGPDTSIKSGWETDDCPLSYRQHQPAFSNLFCSAAVTACQERSRCSCFSCCRCRSYCLLVGYRPTGHDSVCCPSIGLTAGSILTAAPTASVRVTLVL
jgi:hypothetical protein